MFEKLNKAVLDGLGGSLGTGISNADRDFIQRTTANIGNTKEGNRQIIDVGIKLAERKQQIAQKAAITPAHTMGGWIRASMKNWRRGPTRIRFSGECSRRPSLRAGATRNRQERRHRRAEQISLSFRRQRKLEKLPRGTAFRRLTVARW